MIDFLKATKFSIINGHISPNKNNFTHIPEIDLEIAPQFKFTFKIFDRFFTYITYITTNGKSVVDYFLTSHYSLQFCKEFEVMPSSYLVEKV